LIKFSASTGLCVASLSDFFYRKDGGRKESMEE